MKKEIVEINGVKFEVDLSKAKVITEYKIGDMVNVLVKDYQEKKVYPGIIVGFDNFKNLNLPTITIAYLKMGYSTADIVFFNFNSESKDVDIAPCRVSDVAFRKENVVTYMEREIAKKQEEVKDLQRKKDFFLDNFSKHFAQFKVGEEA